MNKLEILKELIALPTISKDSNLKLINYVINLLDQFNVKHHLQVSDCGQKYNLIASMGPIEKSGIVLAAHTDVVPVLDQTWSTDPFEAVIKNDKIFGRGSCDMKGFIAAILANLPFMAESFKALKIPIHIVLTYDEEVGCYGAKKLKNFFIENSMAQPKICIVGEPSNMQLANMHKGIQVFYTKITGVSGHSSIQTNTANAINIAANIIEQIAKFIANSRMATTSKTDFAAPSLTFNIGKISGGSAINIVADQAEFLWEIRYIKETEKNNFLQQFYAYSDEYKNEINTLLTDKKIDIKTDVQVSVPSLSGDNKGFNIDILLNLLDNKAITHVDFAAEAGVYQDYWGCHTFICGPGSIIQAHKADEFLEKSQLELAEKFIHKLIMMCMHYDQQQ